MSNHTDIEDLREALVGRSVTSVQLGGDLPHKPYETTEGKLTLDDGTVLLLGGNTGGCSCGAGDYELVRLNEMPVNGIMNVEITDEADEYGEHHTYRIFVLAQDQRFELAAFEGDDGNGYYGTGFWFTVLAPEPATD
jgi:hypothetical protein